MELPPANRLLRNVDQQFLEKLILEMEGNSHGAHEPLFLHIKDCTKKQFKPENVSEYKYEVLGGTHKYIGNKKVT